ncbi:hypothetical protein Droror1_Dr00012815 [Drosera rotundifolia]
MMQEDLDCDSNSPGSSSQQLTLSLSELHIKHDLHVYWRAETINMTCYFPLLWFLISSRNAPRIYKNYNSDLKHTLGHQIHNHPSVFITFVDKILWTIKNTSISIISNFHELIQIAIHEMVYLTT